MSETHLHAMEKIPLDEIVKQEYRIYQIYTLMDRAIPYLRDGLKPSQRRILFTLWRNQSKGLMKVSSATGLVLTLHPHGPASIEASIVNLAQDFTFSNNYPLIDKKGYFGERMEPTPAASRYIECKLGKMAEVLLFDDMNQVPMIPNYDEKVMEPAYLLPKLPLMLLNGAEGIGTGFSSVIPSFHHKDIVKSMLSYIQTGKTKRIHHYVRYYQGQIFEDEKRFTFPMRIEQKADQIVITELPRGYDAQKIYRHLGKFIESGYLKDYVDSSVDNEISIELLFKKGQQPPLKDVIEQISATSALTANYTLISEKGVKIFEKAEEILEIFTLQRLEVVQKRYQLLAIDAQEKITQNNEIIRFIKEKHYEVATKSKNRKAFTDHLQSKKFTFFDYLADMPIYRMTIEEVQKREMIVQDEKKKLAEYKKVASSEEMVRTKLVEELNDVDEKLEAIIKDRDKKRSDLYKQLAKSGKKTRNKKNEDDE